MGCGIYCLFILSIAPVIFGLKLQVDGKMDFGPKWNYEYRIKPLEPDVPRSFTAMDRQKAFARERREPRFVDIIIKNKKTNPRLIQVAEAHIFDGKNDDDTQRESHSIVNIFHNTSAHKDIRGNANGLSIQITEKPLKFSHEHTDNPKFSLNDILMNSGKYAHHLIRFADDVDGPKSAKHEEFQNSPEISTENSYRTVLAVEQKKKHKHQRANNGTKTRQDDNESAIQTHEKLPTKAVTFELIASAEQFYSTEKGLYVEPRLVKDDPKIKEFTKHIYEQSIKTFQTIKDKLTNYEIKKEADRLMRSYEDKFGEFVRETQIQKIKTKLGSKKVILNTLDTSNRILDRLVNYMIGKIGKGSLRNSGAENVIKNEMNKNKDLENKHICVKMQICPNNESLPIFMVDVLGTVLSSSDNQFTEFCNAFTEVLKNVDYSNVLDSDAEKHVLRGISTLERYDVGTMRTIFFLLRNILTSKNSPIKVVGKEDNRVNKTLAFLEIIDNWDKQLPPNEKNVLEWNDMRNSFNEWKIGKRHDTMDLMQHYTDLYITKVLSKKDVTLINTILGY